MYSTEDYQRLKQHQIIRLLELLPQLAILKPEIEGEILSLTIPDTASIPRVKEDKELILKWTAIVLGLKTFKLYWNGKVNYFASLQSLEEYQQLSAMTVTTLEKEAELAITQELKQETLIPWDFVATAICKIEEHLRQIAAEKRIPIIWTNNGKTWAFELEDSDRLIAEYYAEQRDLAMARVREKLTNKSAGDANTNGSSTGIATSSPEKKSTKAPKRIKLQKEFRPANGKNLFVTIERYLDAIAPENPEEQAEIVNEVVKDSAIGNKHLDKIMTSYTEDMRKPTRFGLQSAFEKFSKRKPKDDESTKVANNETESKSQTEVAVAEEE